MTVELLILLPVLLLPDFAIQRALTNECMRLHWILMARGCWLPLVWFGPQYIRFPPLSDRPRYFFFRNGYRCIHLQFPAGTRPWKWIEDITSQFFYHKCGLASNTANVHHRVCRPLRPGHIYFMIHIKQGNRFEILSMSGNQRYYCGKRLVKLLVTTCFPASNHFYRQSHHCGRLLVRQHFFCMEELCLYFVAELYTLESSNVFLL